MGASVLGAAVGVSVKTDIQAIAFRLFPVYHRNREFCPYHFKEVRDVS